MYFRWPLPVAFALTLAACATPPASEPTVPPMPSPAAAVLAAPALVSGMLLANFDRTVRPQDDLYRFVNGTWLKNTEIPADKSNYGAFTVLEDGAQKNLRVIVEEAAATNAAGRLRLPADRGLLFELHGRSACRAAWHYAAAA